jgi:phage baseplate assembly protein W
MELTISLPFKLNSYGSINTTIDYNKIWLDRVLSVVGTAVRERVMQPTIGTYITEVIFDNQDTAQAEIQKELENAFVRQLSNLNLISTQTNFDSSTGVLSITLTYALPNKEVVNTVIGFVISSGTAPIYQELT